MKWIKEHLNISLVIGVLLIESPLIVYYILGSDFGYIWWYLIPIVIFEILLEIWYS